MGFRKLYCIYCQEYVKNQREPKLTEFSQDTNKEEFRLKNPTSESSLCNGFTLNDMASLC